MLESEMQAIIRSDIKKEISAKEFQKATKKIIKDKLDDRVDPNYLDGELRRLQKIKKEKVDQALRREHE